MNMTTWPSMDTSQPDHCDRCGCAWLLQPMDHGDWGCGRCGRVMYASVAVDLEPPPDTPEMRLKQRRTGARHAGSRL